MSYNEIIENEKKKHRPKCDKDIDWKQEDIQVFLETRKKRHKCWWNEEQPRNKKGKKHVERPEKDLKQVQFLNLSLSRQPPLKQCECKRESPLLKVKHAHDRLIKSLRALLIEHRTSVVHLLSEQHAQRSLVIYKSSLCSLSFVVFLCNFRQIKKKHQNS